MERGVFIVLSAVCCLACLCRGFNDGFSWSVFLRVRR